MKVLVISIQATGHMNMCIGLCQELLKRGHHILFAVSRQWKDKLAPYGFEEVPYTENYDKENMINIAENFALAYTRQKNKDKFSRNLLFADFMYDIVGDAQNLDPIYEQLINEHKPDLILSEDGMPKPFLERAAAKGIPWVRLNSCAPLCMEVDGLPPCWLGLSTTNPDPELWKEKRRVRDAIYDRVIGRLNEWRVSEGLKPHQGFLGAYWSPFLNVYNYPKELDYFEGVKLPAPVARLDSCVRQLPDRFEFPEEFLAIPGKHTVYVSMGTLASINANLMQRIVDALGDTPNRYFVSKGANGDKLKLPSNCYGANFVAQTEILPLVDAIITHGGNNTFTECFYYGVPMIVMPFFCDQCDNAQRLADLNLGYQLDPFNFDDKELLVAVDSILNDSNVRVRMRQISKRIRNDRSMEKVVQQIEALVQPEVYKK